MILSVIIPVYNEEKTVAKLIKNVAEITIDKQIIVCNDGSTDSTERILGFLKNKYDLTIVTHKKNRGKGSAIRTAARHVQGEIVVIQDADLETKPKNYLELIKPILDGKTDVVLTYRIRSFGSLKMFIYKIYFIGAVFQTLLANLLFRAHIHDINSGCKMLKSDIFKGLNLKSNGFDIDQEIAVKVLKKRCKVKEFPIMYFPRTGYDGKKIRLFDGIKGLFAIIKYRVTD